MGQNVHINCVIKDRKIRVVADKVNRETNNTE